MDDLEWEEWMQLTEEQQNAICAREERAYFEWLNSLSLADQYAHHRGMAVRSCLKWRGLMRRMGWTDGYWLELLRERQMRLLKLRIWRATGMYPGSA